MTAPIARSWPGRGPDIREPRLSLSRPRQRVVVPEPSTDTERLEERGMAAWRAHRETLPPPPEGHRRGRAQGVGGDGPRWRTAARPPRPSARSCPWSVQCARGGSPAKVSGMLDVNHGLALIQLWLARKQGLLSNIPIHHTCCNLTSRNRGCALHGDEPSLAYRIRGVFHEILSN